MKMVAASHLHRAQAELHLPEPFAAELWKLVPVMKQTEFETHRVCLAPPERGSRVLLVVMTSNRGLCGAFNNSVVREVRRWVKEQTEARGIQVEAIYAGLKGYTALRREITPCMDAVDVTAHPQAKETAAISRHAMDSFMAKKYDEVWIAHNRFVNSMSNETRVQRVLPYQDRPLIARPEKIPETAPNLIEPNDDRMLEAIFRQWMHLGVYFALLHSVASEHAARVLAMENATVNLRRMEKDLILLRNRARQAAITNELTEIVSGAESLS
jgi:F-type H+-transporting ATPase subunit gamma